MVTTSGRIDGYNPFSEVQRVTLYLAPGTTPEGGNSNTKNLVRVVTLILVTYYFGEAAGQGFIHDFAGLTVFLVALLAIFGVDALFSRLRERRSLKP